MFIETRYLIPRFRMNFSPPVRRRTKTKTDFTYRQGSCGLAGTTHLQDQGNGWILPKLLDTHSERKRGQSIQRRSRVMRRAGDISSHAILQEDLSHSSDEGEHHELEEAILIPDQKRVHGIQEGLKIYLTAKSLNMQRAQKEEHTHRNKLIATIDPIYQTAKGPPAETSQQARKAYSNFRKVLREKKRPIFLAKAKQWESREHIRPARNINSALRKHVEEMFPKGARQVASSWDFYVSEVRRLSGAYAAEATARIAVLNAWVRAAYFSQTLTEGLQLAATIIGDELDQALRRFLHEYEGAHRVQKDAYHNTDHLGHTRKAEGTFHEHLLSIHGDHTQLLMRKTWEGMNLARDLENDLKVNKV